MTLSSAFENRIRRPEWERRKMLVEELEREYSQVRDKARDLREYL